MDDREPGKIAPDPNAMASGWSLAHALDGASRRAKPKASLSRHLVGYRTATDEDDASALALAASEHDPDARAMLARASLSGEVAWAHERLSLIARALDDEASRLAADPQKAGKVAEHLAPLIEQAFAGADAEAPGDYARSIVGREREPLGTELLAERAVMSVAATQRAERSGRSAALADELARLKEQPQRWAAAYARQGRAIDDLPLDETRKHALKGAMAQAQANAAAEGLLQQDATWLLEDLDDPEFASALGADDTARWRSEAETAIARRAERIAVESAERALLAAADMRATLKRFKDEDDGPLPSAAEVAVALGGEAAADEAMSATLKGRKRRYAETAVAMMAPADEAGWIAAAPDKEARTIRELAAAAKHAAVVGNPGRWLMRHSATLREIAKDATDDPAHLPRLVEQYAALRNQVRGRAANDDGTGAAGEDAARASADANAQAPLPDEVAAALVEQVLAGETPQARFDALTKILDGAAGAGSDEGYGAGADADGRAQAGSIASQLETLGLPDGTEALWARLSDPYTRRAGRLALLGAFAKQIREEETILGGHDAEPEIVGEEGEDTLAKERAARLEAIRNRVNALVDSGSLEKETAERFLGDERLVLLDEALNASPEDDLDGPGDQQLIANISQAADWVLYGAEQLAALEEEYGEFVHAAVLSGRSLMGGPLGVYLGHQKDRAINSAVTWFIENYYNEAFDVVSRRLSETFGVDRQTADRWATASTIIAIAGIGFAGRTRDLMGFVRHFAGARIRSRGTGSSAEETIDPKIVDENRRRLDQLDTSEIIKGNPRLYDHLASIIQNGTGRTSTEDILRAMEGPDFDELTQEAKDELARRISRDIIGLAAQDFVTNGVRSLPLSRALQIMENFGIRFDHRRPRPDLLLTSAGVDTTQLKKFTDTFIELAKRGRVFLIEIKAGYGELSDAQTYGYNRMKDAHVENAFLQLNVPIRMIPPEFIYKRLDGLIAAGKLPNPPLDPKLVRQVVENLHYGLDPKTPVWVLDTLAVVALATIAEVPIAAFDDSGE